MKRFSRKQIAEILNNSNAFDELSQELLIGAKESNLVVLFGREEDGKMIFVTRGAINSEHRVDMDDIFSLIQKGEKWIDIFNDDVERVAEETMFANTGWVYENKMFFVYNYHCVDPTPWVIHTDFRASGFETIKDGKTYCKGLVIDLDDYECK